jgi:hypothetical protein
MRARRRAATRACAQGLGTRFIPIGRTGQGGGSRLAPWRITRRETNLLWTTTGREAVAASLPALPSLRSRCRRACVCTDRRRRSEVWYLLCDRGDLDRLVLRLVIAFGQRTDQCDFLSSFSARSLSLIRKTGPDLYQALFLLGVLVGAIQILIAVFKLGDLTRYVSELVIIGFMASLLPVAIGLGGQTARWLAFASIQDARSVEPLMCLRA